MFEQDWFMRQVQMMIEVIARLLFNSDTVEYEIPDSGRLSESDRLHLNLLRLIADRDICGAEDMLWDCLDFSDKRYFELALDFYNRLNGFSDEELETFDFSREEIDEGIKSVSEKFGFYL